MNKPAQAVSHEQMCRVDTALILHETVREQGERRERVKRQRRERQRVYVVDK